MLNNQMERHPHDVDSTSMLATYRHICWTGANQIRHPVVRMPQKIQSDQRVVLMAIRSGRGKIVQVTES